VSLVKFLQTEIEYLLHKPFGDTNLAVQAAKFDRDGSPPRTCSEIVRSDENDIHLSWSGFLDSRSCPAETPSLGPGAGTARLA
jgi:hypothetical protein